MLLSIRNKLIPPTYVDVFTWKAEKGPVVPHVNDEDPGLGHHHQVGQAQRDQQPVRGGLHAGRSGVHEQDQQVSW